MSSAFPLILRANMSINFCNTDLAPLMEQVVEYKECQRNHTATLGHVTIDGCQEFVQLGEDGSANAFTCAGCNCHRNFHKQEVTNKPAAIRSNPVNGVAPAPASASASARRIRSSVHVNNNDDSDAETVSGIRRRRSRVRFTTAQRAQLMRFAVKIGWRTRHTPADLIEGFCREMGITRRVLRDWLSNNRHLKHSITAASTDGGSSV